MDEEIIGLAVIGLVVIGLIGVFYIQATSPVYEKTICVKDIYQREYRSSPSITTMDGEFYYVPANTVWSQFVKGKSHTIHYTKEPYNHMEIVDIVGKIGEYPCEPTTTLPIPYLSKP